MRAALIHSGTRFRLTLIDGLRLRRYDQLIAVGMYGTALVGSLPPPANVLLFAI